MVREPRPTATPRSSTGDLVGVNVTEWLNVAYERLGDACLSQKYYAWRLESSKRCDNVVEGIFLIGVVWGCCCLGYLALISGECSLGNSSRFHAHNRNHQTAAAISKECRAVHPVARSILYYLLRFRCCIEEHKSASARGEGR